MVSKIISGGQTGVDRAALDVAIEMGIPHGGWVPKGRKAEDGVIPGKYEVEETSGDRYPERTEKNIAESDGTLIISRGKLTGGSALTRGLAIKQGRPWLHTNLEKSNPFITAKTIVGWITDYDIRILNIAGPRASQDPEIYEMAGLLLKTVIYLMNVETYLPEPSMPFADVPGSVDEAIEKILKQLPLRERMEIAYLEERDLVRIQGTLGEYIQNRFGLPSVNIALMASCRTFAGGEDIGEDQAAALIVRELRKTLRETYVLRRIK